MATSFSAKLSLALEALLNVTNGASSWVERYKLGSSLFPAWTLSLTNGTGARQAQKIYFKKHNIPVASPVTIDLTAATGDSASLGAINFSKIKFMLFRIRVPTTGIKLVVGNAAATPFSAWLSAATTTEDVFDILLRTNEIDGWTVDGTHKNLLLTSSGGTIDVDVLLIGQ